MKYMNIIQVKSIKTILSDFTSNKCLKYRCSSEIIKYINEVKKILIKNSDFKDIFYEFEVI